MSIHKSLLVFTLLLIALATLACSTTAPLQGTDLGGAPAPDFRLADQTGNSVALSSLRPRVVVLTFLYTHCTDVCPLIAAKLSRVYDQLGAAAQQVSFVAVSVDPEGDTPLSIAEFSRRVGMEGKWLYLSGPRAQLEPVWQAYYLGIETPVPPGTQVGHSSRVVLIDRAGRERVNLDPDFEPDSLHKDLRILIGE